MATPPPAAQDIADEDLDADAARIVQQVLEADLAVLLEPTGSAVELYRRTGWREVGRTRPAWLDADAPDVVAMILPAGS